MDSSKMMQMISEMEALLGKMKMACGNESQEESDEMDMEDSPDENSSDKKKMFVAMMKKKNMEG